MEPNMPLDNASGYTSLQQHIQRTITPLDRGRSFGLRPINDMCVFVSFSFPFGLFPFIPFFSIQIFPSPFFYQVMLIIFFLVFSPSVHFTLPLIVFSHVFPSILSYYFFYSFHFSSMLSSTFMMFHFILSFVTHIYCIPLFLYQNFYILIPFTILSFSLIHLSCHDLFFFTYLFVLRKYLFGDLVYFVPFICLFCFMSSYNLLFEFVLCVFVEFIAQVYVIKIIQHSFKNMNENFIQIQSSGILL